MDFSTYKYLLKYSLVKSKSLNVYLNAIRNQHLPKDELEKISWNKTLKILNYAFENVPWYYEKYSAIGLNPKDITKPKHFNQIPIITRSDLSNHFDEFISNKANPKSLKVSTTGGSSGVPIKIGMQKYGIRESQKWQMYSWWGLSPSVNMASIYRGVPVESLKKVALNFINWPQKVIRLDATQISEEKIVKFIEQCKKVKPKLIHGYVGGLDAIADYIIDNDIDFPTPKVIWSTAAPLTLIQEEKISKAFNAPICDQYGCSEVYFISAECKCKNGLHIFSDAVKVEFLDEFNEQVKTNEYGKIVLTNLDEFHFPLIRYENGDRGRLLNNKCNCGMSHPLMDKVKGRISDNIILPDGTILAGEYLTTIFDDFTDSVKQFQIIQKKDKSIQVKIVLTQLDKLENIQNSIYNELLGKIRNQVGLDIQFVNEVLSIKGKLQFIIKE